MFGVFANDANNAAPFDDFTFVADTFDRSANFHEHILRHGEKRKEAHAGLRGQKGHPTRGAMGSEEEG